jgi:glycerol transport system ATP-binding protein
LSLPPGSIGPRSLTVGIRASALRVQPRNGDTSLPGTVELAEISGSDTFVHVASPVGDVVAQLPGVHQFTIGEPITLYLGATQVYVFDAGGDLLVAPAETNGAGGSN